MRTVVLTPTHRIAGILDMREGRLSDFLNDKRESVMRLYEAEIVPLRGPASGPRHETTAVIHKRAAVIAYGTDDPTMTSTQRMYARVEKRTNPVMILFDGIEAHGRLHTSSELDVAGIQALMTQPGADRFIPLTDAVVRIGDDHGDIREETVMVNGAHIRLIALEGVPPR